MKKINYLDSIRNPIITEKATILSEQNKSVFKVHESANKNVIKKNRDLMGATNPKDAKEGTIRQKFAISIDKNSVHGSDSEENASKEISLFFSW